MPKLLGRIWQLDFDIVYFLYGEAMRDEIQTLLLDKAALLEELPLPFSLLSGSPGHRCSQHLLFLEKVTASLALQDLDHIHEVGDLHQRNWTAIEACLVSDLRPAGFGKPSACLVLGSF